MARSVLLLLDGGIVLLSGGSDIAKLRRQDRTIERAMGAAAGNTL